MVVISLNATVSKHQNEKSGSEYRLLVAEETADVFSLKLQEILANNFQH